MLASLSPHLEAQHAPLKAALSELVRIPSVCAEGREGRCPFGAAVDQALRTALQIAGDLGFRTHYGDDGYYGYAEIGDGAELVGVLGHLDVVPPGKLEDWTGTDPFDPVEAMGCLYGRGTQDDKGPLLAALFAVKALMDAGVKFNKRVRFHLRDRRGDALALHQPLQGKRRAAGAGVFARRAVPADLC